MDLSHVISVWALQSVSKDNILCPETIDSVMLPFIANILDATKKFSAKIITELVDRGVEVEEGEISPEKLLKMLGEFNSRSLSFFVVRIHPPSWY